jgi:putative radical SAM enzyme (TIGR03279 family)
VKIAAVTESSPAAIAGVQVDDELIAIDDGEVRDFLDYQFLASDMAHDFTFRRGNNTFTVELVRQGGEEFGIELPDEKVRCCGNKCTFCFIDQNPKGLRRTLYVKDEDYRLSLTYGNYVTLTNLEEWEIERIMEQNLSPLYVSVHATDPLVRRQLLRSRHTDEITPILERLTAAGIRMHTQIVLVPEVNDGDCLRATLDDLERLVPEVETVAIVPVGLTAHRSRLAKLREFTGPEAADLIDEITTRQSRCLETYGRRIHFLADEFYLLASKPLPPAEDYEDFPQIENGVGMIRRFEHELDETDQLITKAASHTGRERIGLLTGTLFTPVLRKLLEPALERTGEKGTFDIEVMTVQNRLFGSPVTVAGLLSGGDIIEAMREQTGWDRVLLSPEMFNSDGYTLDQMTAADMAGAIHCPIQIDFNGPVVSGV